MLKNTYRSSLTLGFITLYLFSTPVLSTTTYTPGDTAGEFGVDGNGQATYQFPIVVPPGTGGMVPSLSLNYNSSNGNGLMGMGWTLGGLSVITRCPATKFTDGFADRVDFDEHDRYCLDGQRLILITSGSTNGAHESEYRTAIVDPENFSKVIAYNADNNHSPEYFKVWTKSGQIMEYGATTDSRIEVPGQEAYVRLWAVNKISDTAGNYLTVSYTEDNTNSSYRPRHIDYTGNANARPALSPYNRVSFEYEDEDRDDTAPLWPAGIKVINTRRLSHIKTYIDTGTSNTLVRDYRLAYGYSLTSKRSRLLSITECSGDAGTPCLPPLTFQWPDQPATAYTETAAYALPEPLYDSNGNRKGQLIDLNIDGLTDYVHGTTIWVNRGKVVSRNVSGTVWRQLTGSTQTLPDAIDSKHGQFVDVNGDGYPDWVRAYHKNGRDYKATFINNKRYFTKFVENTDYTLDTVIYNGNWVNGQFADLNGDKRADWVHASFSNKATYINTGSGWQQNTDYALKTVMYYGNQRRGQLVDVNGDGLPDWVYTTANYKATYINTGTGWRYDSQYNLPTVIYSGTQVQGQFVDVNGDGLPDWVHAYGNIKNTYINTGSGWQEDTNYTPPSAMYNGTQVRGQLVDVNGDGLPDWVKAYRSGNTDDEATYINTGTGWQEDAHYTLPALISDDTRTRGEFADINGDGMMDWVQAYTSGSTEYKQTWLNNQAQTDVITGITTGLGSQTQISYKPTDSSVYSKYGFAATYPAMDIRPPMMYVVKSIRVPDGLGQQLQTDYHYTGARAHRDHGFVGFYYITRNELATGLESTTLYYQDYPRIGKAWYQYQSIPVPQTDGRTIKRTLSYSHSGMTSRQTHAGVGLATGHPGVLFAYTRSTTQIPYNPYEFYVHQKRIDTSYTYDNFGSPTRIVETTNMPLHRPAYSVASRYTRTTANTYQHDTANWLLGRLTRTTVTSRQHFGGCTSLPGGCSGTRTSGFVYDGTTGLLTQETIEPDTPEPETPVMQQITSYTRDAYGNILTTTVSGGSGTTAVADRVTTTGYDSKGRFATSTIRTIDTVEHNTVEHSETRTYDAGSGNLRSLTDPNGLTTRWEYDNFGQQTKETRTDGTTTTITREWCQNILNQTGGANHCPSNGTLVQTTTTTGAPKTRRYSDQLGRVIRTQTQGFDVRHWSTIDTKYNNLGQTHQVSEPYYPGDTVYWETTEYEPAGRISRVTAADGSVTRSTYGGQGIKTTVTNAKDQTKTVIHNVLELPVLVIENGNTGTAIRKHYDVFGNLVVTCKGTDPCSSTDTSAIKNTYDVRGNKIETVDPDRGTWTYQYNAVGELIKQTDAKGYETTFTYDGLGRMTERRETEGTTTWDYDSTTKGIGKLASVNYLDNNQMSKQESYSYNDDGRLASTVTTIDSTSYTTSQTYDTSGRLDVLTYPQSTTYPDGLQVQHHYNDQGYLHRINNTSATQSQPSWEATAMNARGQLTRYRYGNGAVNERNYSPQTGFIQSTVGSPEALGLFGVGLIQKLSYQFDSLGNLTQRQNTSGNRRTENFLYDNLNRMTQSEVERQSSTPGITQPKLTRTYSYDNRGNLSSQTDTDGTSRDYTYGSKVGSTLNAGGIHAVISAGGSTIQYDANGNVTSNRNFTAVDDRTIEWTSYNQVKQITQGSTGSTTINSYYGANRELYKQTVNGVTRIYVSPLYEKEGTTHIHYIKAMGQTIALFKDSPNVPSFSRTRYLHHDHIGSIVAVTDHEASIRESLSYDPWGKRRQTTWEDATTQIFSSELDKSFLEHHYLDKVGLINTGGRFYDPDLGRFLSAAPFIQALDNSQSYNRYAVQGCNAVSTGNRGMASCLPNNPLSYTDPGWVFLQETILQETILQETILSAHIYITR